VVRPFALRSLLTYAVAKNCCNSSKVSSGRSSWRKWPQSRLRPLTVEAAFARQVARTSHNGPTGIEVQARITNDEAQDQETASYAYELLDRLASLAGKNPAPSENFARETVSPSAAKTTPTKSRSTSSKEGSPVHAVITKIDRMKTRQGDSLFLKVDVGGETVRVFGRPEELAERLEASGYDIPASEIEAGMELHLPCLVKVGQGHNGYKNIEEFLPEAAE
jgi:hypothetical protein